MIIYKITNNVNGMSYIGQTTQPMNIRWHQHCSPSSTYCKRLHVAIQKYGKKSFSIEKICDAKSIEELNDLEGYYISLFNTISPNGYNLLSGGNNKRHSEETKAQMSKSHKGVKIPALSVPRGEMPMQQRINISNAKKGNNGLKGTKRGYIPHPANYKPIMGINLETGLVVVYKSIIDAEAVHGHRSNIIASAKGRRNHAGGYKWSYI